MRPTRSDLRSRFAARVTKAGFVAGLAAFGLAMFACGETRLPIGDECLRSEDCLSGYCASRTCVAAPPLVNGGAGPPPDETPRIPVAEGGTDAPVSDAAGGG
ncbi:MAG: hypothetical protein JST00_28585 [Deltaproteobacteria bacterium]|nr:hypothetical protein [Deltaproteobacteria bacterium]